VGAGHIHFLRICIEIHYKFKLPQGTQRFIERGPQQRASFYVFNGMGAVPIKADGSFFPGSAHLDPRARPVAQWLHACIHDNRQFAGFGEPVMHCFFEDPSLGFYLSQIFQLLQVASAAFSEMRAYRRHTPISGLQDLRYFRTNERLFFFDRAHAQAIAGNRERHKDHLALVFAKPHASIDEFLNCNVKSIGRFARLAHNQVSPPPQCLHLFVFHVGWGFSPDVSPLSFNFSECVEAEAPIHMKEFFRL
jgi:hypothetical protein